MTDPIIPFKQQDRLLAKARAYVLSADEMLQDPDEAIGLLFKAVKLADEDLKLKIVLMLGALARPQVVWPLYKLMHDTDESESVRQAAAIQLSVVGSMLPDCKDLVAQLKADLCHSDPFVRANAAFALGWEGNESAVFALVECLYTDEDPEVQQTAVNALGNLGDARLFALLAERLAHGTKEQKRTILYNLHRFSSRRREVIEIYCRYMRDSDPDLRYDALAVFNSLGDPARYLSQYQERLEDPEARIRCLALAGLLKTAAIHLKPVENRVRRLLHDPDPGVRCAAIKVCHRMAPHTILL